MPTRRGWLAVIVGLSAIVLGRLLGLSELYVIGAVTLTLVVAASVVAVARPLRLAVARSVNPARLHVGSVGQVELAVRNGELRTPVMQMTDHVEGTSGAQLFLSPLAASGTARAAYKLPTERRGIVGVGPVKFQATDPFGLAIRRYTAPNVGQLVVYPEVIPIPPAPPSPATERRSTSDVPEFLGGRSDEFHALRQYVPGDDIRRISWPSSARHDELIVREDEAPTQNHLTVLLDNAALPGTEALDKGCTVAASLTSAVRNRNDPFRLITMDGHDTGYVIGRTGLDRALSILAITEHPAPGGPRQHPIDDAQGAVVVVTSTTPTLHQMVTSRFNRVMMIMLAPSVWDPTAVATPSSADAVGNAITLQLGSIHDLASLWSRAITTLMTVKVTR